MQRDTWFEKGFEWGVIERLVHDETVIVVDDVWRVAERELAETVSDQLGRAEMYDGASFAIIN